MPLIDFIPTRFEEGFKKLSLLSVDQFNSIKEGLSYTALSSSLTELSDNVATFKSLNPDDIREIFISVGSLIPYIIKEDVRLEVAEDIATIGLYSKIIKGKKAFKERLLFLLNSSQVYYASKTRELSNEYGNIYIGARVICDIRPVFGMNLDEAPKGGIIIHSLHIHYKADAESDHKDIFLALTSKDIQTLKDMLIRSEKKENALKLVLEKSGLTNLSN
jgi:hypothetical protein